MQVQGAGFSINIRELRLLRNGVNEIKDQSSLVRNGSLSREVVPHTNIFNGSGSVG